MAESRSEPGRPPTLLGVSLKLYLDVERTARWAQEVAALARRHPAIEDGSVELFVLPSLPAVPEVLRAFADTRVRVGAQDLHWADRGAYTGAVSGQDLRAIGCSLVEVGHAERRQIFGESDDVVGAKVAAAFRNGLVPVLCVGEHERVESSEAARVCISQIERALRDIEIADAEIIVAYEPTWAIGQTEAASAAHVGAVSNILADRVREDPRFSTVRVVYGGSAQPGTLTDLRGDVDGLFLGRYAHDPAEFARIIDEAAALR